MFKKIATAVGYTKAPKATFVMKHPVKGTKALLLAKGAKGLVTTRAGAVLSAAVALPLGFFAGRGLRY
ncbi:MAG: hypothetical protein KY453_12455 [Gemmatimonadetes bacterium]|nr:hypothetical protein [Gemmatimonadota bacterium]